MTETNLIAIQLIGAAVKRRVTTNSKPVSRKAKRGKIKQVAFARRQD
jgi:hypothetical protein